MRTMCLMDRSSASFPTASFRYIDTIVENDYRRFPIMGIVVFY